MDCTGRTTVASVSHTGSLEWSLWLFGLCSCCDPGQWIQLSYDDQASNLAPSHCPRQAVDWAYDLDLQRNVSTNPCNARATDVMTAVYGFSSVVVQALDRLNKE